MRRAVAGAAALLEPEEVRDVRHAGPIGDLREVDLPSTYAEWPDYARFAAAFTPRSKDDSAELGNWALARWRRTGEVPRTLEELRSCLWFEYRRWRFHDRVPDPETMCYCGALVRAMRSHL